MTSRRREVEAEGERAMARYGLLVLPGLELTYDDPDSRLGAHALALGCVASWAWSEGCRMVNDW